MFDFEIPRLVQTESTTILIIVFKKREMVEGDKPKSFYAISSGIRNSIKRSFFVVNKTHDLTSRVSNIAFFNKMMRCFFT